MLETPVQLESNLSQSLDSKMPVRRQNSYRCVMAAFDYWLLGILAFLMIPAFIAARLPFQIDFKDFAAAYGIALSARSAFIAILLLVLGFPLEQTLMPMLRRYRKERVRIAIALATAAGLAFVLGPWLGLLVTTDALALAELMERRKEAFESTLVDILWPGLYLFLSILLTFALNTAVIGIRWAGTYDQSFKHLDWMLFHLSVSGISHWTMSHSPLWLPKLLDSAYFFLYPQLGAVLFLAVLLANQSYAIRYVRTVLIAYTIALIVFAIFPAKGPYFIYPDHVTQFSHSLVTFSVQRALSNDARLIWTHHIPPGAGIIAYFISFPCMHVALAIISVWFLRPWKWIFRIMLAFDAFLLVPAIILLEWHYMIGMFGGVATAFLAIWISGRIPEKAGAANWKSEADEFAPNGAN